MRLTIGLHWCVVLAPGPTLDASLRERNKFWRNFCVGQPHHTTSDILESRICVNITTSYYIVYHRVGLVEGNFPGILMSHQESDNCVKMALSCVSCRSSAGSSAWVVHIDRRRVKTPRSAFASEQNAVRREPMEEVAGERTVGLKSFKIYVSICFNLSVFCIFRLYRLLGFDTLWFHSDFPMSWGPEASEFGSDRRDWKRQDHSGDESHVEGPMKIGGPT